MKRYSVIVSIKAKHRNLEIARFLHVNTPFVCKVRKEMVNEINGVELAATRKRTQKHYQRSAHSLGTTDFVRRVHDMAWCTEILGSHCATSCRTSSSV
ncbi:unnamed protein product [Hymenolepis diminuta]|uniref:Uncharacterized protein n=1 Tax=Hymenolepis diminuta TaxID=6216 RepID=A0A564ZE26_HYMDI|nr:unnamed protein product [Hymenolepis diminuta]